MKTISIVLTCLLLGVAISYAQPIQVQVFTLHPDGEPVALYEDAGLMNKRMDIYPDVHESNVGFILYIDYEFKGKLRARIGAEDSVLYVQKGELGINTRNYDNDLYLYEQPDRNSPIVLKSPEQQTVAIYGIREGWLYVEALSDDGQSVKGWLPPDMQCGSPYTTCG